MARGTWSETNRPKTPGFYNRMVQLARQTAKNISGVLAMPVKSDWGPTRTVIEVKDSQELKHKFGVNMNFTAFKLGNLALLGNPEKLLLYRLADDSAAKGTASLSNSEVSPAVVMNFETLYPSARNFKLSVSSNILNSSNKDISLYEGTNLLGKVENISGTLQDVLDIINKSTIGDYVVGKLVDGATGTLADVSSVEFTGGNNGTTSITNDDYITAMDAFRSYEFDGFTLDGVSDPALVETVKGWGEDCKKEGLDFLIFESTNEATLNAANQKSKGYNSTLMHNGFAKTLSYDGVDYTMSEAMVHIAALALSKNLKGSICNEKTIFTDVQPRLNRSEVDSALEAGTIVLTMDKKSGKAVIVDDVNTYKDYEKKEDEVLGNIRANRFINTVNKVCAVKAEDDFEGQVTGDETGHTIILSGFKNFFDEWKHLGIISGYTAETDEENQSKAQTDEYFWKWSADYVNVTKRIYSTGNLVG